MAESTLHTAAVWTEIGMAGAALIALVVYGTAIKPVNMVGMSLLVIGMYLMGK